MGPGWRHVCVDRMGPSWGHVCVDRMGPGWRHVCVDRMGPGWRHVSVDRIGQAEGMFVWIEWGQAEGMFVRTEHVLESLRAKLYKPKLHTCLYANHTIHCVYPWPWAIKSFMPAISLVTLVQMAMCSQGISTSTFHWFSHCANMEWQILYHVALVFYWPRMISPWIHTH